MAAAFERYIRHAIQTGSIAGAAVSAVNKKGDFLLNQAFGKCDIGDDARDFEMDTTFWLASSTKLLTSIAILQLVEQGHVSLTEPIGRLLPEWKDPQILTGFDENDKPCLKPASKPLTLTHLMTHSSGIGYDLVSENLARYRKAIQMAPTIPAETPLVEAWPDVLLFEPGEDWEYGVGLDWAGLIVERITGLKLGEYLKANVFDKLGMSDTSFEPWKSNTMMRRMHGRLTRDEHGKLARFPPGTFEPTVQAFDHGGDGCYSTTADYIKVLKSILTQDGELLKSETIERYMRQGHLEPLAKQGMKAKMKIPLWGSTTAIALPWDDENVEFDHGIASALMMTKIDGVCDEGMMYWSGYPNNNWYIDMERGVAAHYGTWIVPAGDKLSNEAFGEFRKAMYREIGQS